MAVLEARPTEYRGVVYRSKCEAMFARWLELKCTEEGDPFGIIYEPTNYATLDGWVPDFLVWSVENVDVGMPQLRRILYEYKPSRPTETYLQTYHKRTAELQASYASCCGPGVSHQLIYGSVYTKDRGRAFGNATWLDYQKLNPLDWIGDFERAIKETRFDLEVQRG